ncbi:MAG: hypothetical protein M3Q47_16695 [Actinomycetota bacterium]|nr:hypothetical protein [Actinomycetota bacterium]
MTAAPPQHRPTLADDRLAQGRESALWTSALATVLAPAWSGFDVLLEPQAAPGFVAVRLACTVPMLIAVWALWRLPSAAGSPGC